MTYLLFALKDQEVADLYLNTFCKKSDTAKQYVQQWLPIVAAAQLSKDNELEKDFLMKWIDVIDYQQNQIVEIGLERSAQKAEITEITEITEIR